MEKTQHSGDMAPIPNPESDGSSDHTQLRVHLSHPETGSETIMLTMTEVMRASENGCTIHSITSIIKPHRPNW